MAHIHKNNSLEIFNVAFTGHFWVSRCLLKVQKRRMVSFKVKNWSVGSMSSGVIISCLNFDHSSQITDFRSIKGKVR